MAVIAPGSRGGYLDPYGQLTSLYGFPEWVSSLARYVLPDPRVPVPTPAIGGALFKNPVMANLFKSAAQYHPYVVGGMARPRSIDPAIIRFHQDLMKQALSHLFPGESTGVLARNIQSARLGQTFGKDILPWSGAAYRNPIVVGDEQRLLYSLLTGMVP